MNIKKPMPLLLIEDDEHDVKAFKEFIISMDDVKIVKTTNSSKEGIKALKTYMPEGVILDLELHQGEGSGLEFLEEMNKTKLDFKPIIIVTTNVASNIIYNYIRKLGADFIFYKKKSDYSVQSVIKSMISLRQTLYNTQLNELVKNTNMETPQEQADRISEKIENELDLIGISHNYKGRKYLYEAIYYMIEQGTDGDSVFTYLSSKHKTGVSSISRAMQTAINHAWKISSIEDLLMYYKARINPEKGVPTPTEFVCYYVEKVRKFI